MRALFAAMPGARLSEPDVLLIIVFIDIAARWRRQRFIAIISHAARGGIFQMAPLCQLGIWPSPALQSNDIASSAMGVGRHMAIYRNYGHIASKPRHHGNRRRGMPTANTVVPSCDRPAD